MKLLTKALRKKLPRLGVTNADKGDEAIVHIKFFLPDSPPWKWFVLEGEPVEYDHKEELDGIDDELKEKDFEFFGLVTGLKVEYGYFTLKELKKVRGPQGLPIERDRHWEPKTLGEVKRENNLS